MLEHYSKRFRFAAQFLAGLMREYQQNPNRAPGVVFLLGAGCSMQYGFPGFQDLLVNIYRDFSDNKTDEIERWPQQKLRDELEALFRLWDAEARRKAIRKHFPSLHGSNCPGYLRLARMRKPFIRAILNMNFDSLLEDACESIGDTVDVRYSVNKNIPGAIYKVHGSVKEHGGEPIIGIDESHIFKNSREERATEKLLTENHVVVLGYSGGDEKILRALRAFRRDSHRTKMKLFVVNVADGERLIEALEERKSRDGFLTGSEACFENFMEALEHTLHNPKEAGAMLSLPDPRPRLIHSTNLEQVAAEQCKKLALNIRASINVAETGRIGIIEHGEELYSSCLKLANSAGIALTSPEKYLILCAGYLHDLGYFLGYSGARAAENPGWILLRGHGEMTAELLRSHLDAEWRRKITPLSYSDESRDLFIKQLIELCEAHCRTPETRTAGTEPSEQAPQPRVDIVEIYGVSVELRFDLVRTLFAAAEELAEGHPFLPSPYPIDEPQSKGWTMEDPVLDLYLHRKEQELQHKILPGEVHVEPEGKPEKLSAAAEWLLILAERTLDEFSRVARSHGGKGIQFKCSYGGQLPRQKRDDALIRSALEESLGRQVKPIAPGSPNELHSLFDLLAIYTLGHSEEPRLDPKTSDTIQGVLRHVQTRLRSGEPIHRQSTVQTSLPQFFLISQMDQPGPMDAAFVRDFQEIIHPGWRLCAQTLREGTDAICLSRLVLDLGSTPFRGEVAFAMRHLYAAKIRWEADGRACVHDWCTLCTSRLLYIFARARLLFGNVGPIFLPKGHNLDAVVQGLLHTLLCKDPEPSWWGIAVPLSAGGGIRSADYLGWVVRALAFCLAVDQDIREKTGSPWLPNRQDVIGLLRNRLEELCSATHDDLLSNLSEEPHSYVAGDVAMTLLQVERHLRDCSGLGFEWRPLLDQAREPLRSAARELDSRNLSLISKLYLWPAKIFLHEDEETNPELTRELMEIYRSCANSPIWIRTGPGAGSWGFNMENTHRLITVLNLFWRYAFEKRSMFEELFSDTAA